MGSCRAIVTLRAKEMSHSRSVYHTSPEFQYFLSSCNLSDSAVSHPLVNCVGNAGIPFKAGETLSTLFHARSWWRRREAGEEKRFERVG